MSIKKVSKNKWLADIQPNGRHGKRIRRHFETKAEAQAFSNWAHEQARQNKEWAMPKKDTRTLEQLINEWYEGHGKTLIKSENRLKTLKTICKDLNNPYAENITPETGIKIRTIYLNKGLEKTTINKYLQYINIMFNKLIKLKKWTKENPFKDIEPLKTKDLDICYLSTNEIKQLLSKLEQSRSKDVVKITKICLATGARWSEAQNLTKSQIGEDRITFVKTKNGKIRTVPLDKKLCDELKSSKNEKLFKNSYRTFLKYLKTCDFKIRKNQASHILRHTFATHFMKNGGNILILKEILGHQDIKMTMIYAHYAPEHLEQVKTLNPLNSLTL